MVFNEILIPQDPFTETNVARKKSIVGIHNFIPKSFKIPHFFVLIFFYPKKNMKAIVRSHDMPK